MTKSNHMDDLIGTIWRILTIWMTWLEPYDEFEQYRRLFFWRTYYPKWVSCSWDYDKFEPCWSFRQYSRFCAYIWNNLPYDQKNPLLWIWRIFSIWERTIWPDFHMLGSTHVGVNSPTSNWKKLAKKVRKKSGRS